MARPKKVEPDAGGQLMSSADIIWMRDNVITGLSNLEQGVHELRRTYITYFNSRLPEGHPARLNVPFFPSAIYPGENGAVPRRAETPAATGAAAGAEVVGKRKRKPHDPNAPKRALTSYFLFMQDHKPQIKEAHPDWTAAQISAESEKRWENITDEEKTDYDVRYQVDLARYYKQKEAYEAGEPIPEISAAEAQKLYEDQLKSGQPPKGRKVAKAPTHATNAPVQGDAKGEATSSDEEEEASPEPVKAASPPKTDRASKRQKTAKDEAAKASSAKAAGAAKAKATPDSPKADRSSPELDRKKKASKKRDAKADDEDEEAAEVAESSPVKGKSAEKKEKKTRKKRKSEAVVDGE